MTDRKIFCVIPAYNEEDNIYRVIKDLAPLLYSIVIVVDGARDQTYSFAKKAQKDFFNINPKIFVLKHLINRGQGAALETGNIFSIRKGAEIVVHFDADGQFLSRDISAVVGPLIDDSADVVFGSRFLEKKSDIPWLKKNIVLRLARVFNYIVLGVKMTDPQSGFRAMNKKALLTVMIEQDGMAHCSEILSKVSKQGLRIEEVPIDVIYNEYGQKFSGGLKIIKDLFISKF